MNSDTAGLWQLVKKIRSLSDSEVELLVTENCPLLENLLAFELLKKQAEILGKNLTFKFEDRNFSFLTAALNPPSPAAAPVPKTPAAPAPAEGAVSAAILPEKSSRSFALTWPKLSFNFNFKPRLSWIIPAVALVSLLALGGATYAYVYFIPQSRVVLTVDSEPLVRAIDVTASATASAGLADAVIIPALEILASAKKSESTASSGRKDVGDKATGSVTIYNKTGSSVSLPAGTILTSNRGQVLGVTLKFVANAAVTVPARVANPLTVSGYDPGTVNADVTAQTFGDEYNLAAGDTFPVAGHETTDLIAQNTSNFTGGTRRQAVVVVAADQKNLLDSLTAKLKDELKSTLLSKLVSGQNIDENSVTYKVNSKSFDHGVGEEASQLSLALEMEASSMAFSQDELNNAVYGKLLTFVPDGYQLFGKEQGVEVLEAKASGKILKISARGKGFIVPKVSEEDVKRQIAGKSIKEAEAFLKGLSGVSSFKIENPVNLGPFSFLPVRPQNLKVEVVRR